MWTNSHLWEFEIDGERYGIPFDDRSIRNAENAHLTKLAEGKVKEFLYTYDMGDSWEHLVEIVDFFEAPAGTSLPRFLAGEWRTPPEDVGGVPGFELFLEAISDPTHEDHDDLVDGYGGFFDREDIEPDIIKIQMARLSAKRRPKK